MVCPGHSINPNQDGVAISILAEGRGENLPDRDLHPPARALGATSYIQRFGVRASDSIRNSIRWALRASLPTRQCTWAVWSTFPEIHSSKLSLLWESNTLNSLLGPFLVYLLKFTLLTPFLHTFSSLSYTIWGYWNFRLEFVMPYISQHTRDVPNLSYGYDCDLITGFPFALVFTCTFTECVT